MKSLNSCVKSETESIQRFPTMPYYAALGVDCKGVLVGSKANLACGARKPRLLEWIREATIPLNHTPRMAAFRSLHQQRRAAALDFARDLAMKMRRHSGHAAR